MSVTVPITTSLIVTTYNSKDVLQLVLETALKQTTPPSEIIVADDGSRDDTAEMIRSMAQNSPVPILHTWQPNKGFRLARSRNNAIAVSSGEYLIFLDGDCFLNPYFIEDHLSMAKPGFFVVGTRVNILPNRQKYIIRTRNTKISLWSWGTHKKINAIRSRWLSRFFHQGGMAGANFAAWRSDIFNINGFNERFVGHGGEDGEIELRLKMSGLILRKMRYVGMAYHFAHSRNAKGDWTKIHEIFQETIDGQKTRCDMGLDRALEEKDILLKR
jgi:Predicted glycosyltransferases